MGMLHVSKQVTPTTVINKNYFSRLGRWVRRMSRETDSGRRAGRVDQLPLALDDRYAFPAITAEVKDL
jgi:hypothetical protein